jgi:hypothetical protein
MSSNLFCAAFAGYFFMHPYYSAKLDSKMLPAFQEYAWGQNARLEANMGYPMNFADERTFWTDF